MESFNLQDWTRIGAMNLPNKFVLVLRPSSSNPSLPQKIEDEGRGTRTSRGALAEEWFMERATLAEAMFCYVLGRPLQRSDHFLWFTGPTSHFMEGRTHVALNRAVGKAS
jgi:hypothetical protein